jgi:hypothetical protein
MPDAARPVSDVTTILADMRGSSRAAAMQRLVPVVDTELSALASVDALVRAQPGHE